MDQQIETVRRRVRENKARLFNRRITVICIASFPNSKLFIKVFLLKLCVGVWYWTDKKASGQKQGTAAFNENQGQAAS